MRRLLLLLAALLSAGCAPQQPGEGDGPQVSELLGGEGVAGYTRAVGSREFCFPADHNPHDGYRSEWWYLTGNLETGAGRRFGFQVTFFRFALAPSGGRPRSSRWAADYAWMVHAAVTDIAGRRHYAEERLAREALGLAGAEQEPFRLWLENWTLSGTGPGFPWRVGIEGEEIGLQLEFRPLRPPVLQGEKGLSRKGPEPGNASWYYSITRLQTEGVLTVGGERFSVQGLSWLDREWGTSALGPDQVGWDWFALQLDDGTDLMFYRLRNRGGRTDPHSAGTLLLPDGKRVLLTSDDVELEPLRWWTAGSGARYPVAWRMRVGPLDREFDLETVLDAQEMDLSVVYWEGAVKATTEGRTIGRGYLEMTGYPAEAGK